MRLRPALLRSSLFVLLLSVIALPRLAAVELETWVDTPEATFLTPDERREWATLGDDAAREQFKARYWIRRDPTPGTAVNEFRDLVQKRIKIADGTFGFEGTPGSKTARGSVFIVFGAPAHTKDERASATQLQSGRATLELQGQEVGTTWMYDRERTPKLLEMINRPNLSIEFIVDPARRRDRLQSPGIVNRYRELISERSIVNPTLAGYVPGAAPPPAETAAAPSQTAANPAMAMTPQVQPAAAPSAMPGYESLPGAALTQGAAAALATSPSAQVANGFGKVILGSGDEATAVTWFFLPGVDESRTDLQFYGVITADGGEEVARIAHPVRMGSGFTTAGRGSVAISKVRLPAGSYRGKFAVADGKGNVIARSDTALRVPKADEPAVSPLIVASGFPTAAAGVTADVMLGRTVIEARADASFRRAESLWYMLELTNPSDVAGISIEHRLRTKGSDVGAALRYKAALTEVTPGRYVTGFEVPLSNLSPGDYTLYVTVSDGPREELRRADFKVVGE
jgi:GWxTD domain-containing protein